MRLLSFLLLLIFLNGCNTIKDCGVKPTITIKKEDSKTNTNSPTDTKTTPGTVIQDIRENAQPGGQVKCTF
jgi:hypothetical protein